MTIFIEDTAGNRFECDIDEHTHVGNIAADFFEHMEWPEQDGRGRNQRAVVEVVEPPDASGTVKNKRLRSDQSLSDAEVQPGVVLRIFPEAIAGADIRLRNAALAAAFRDMETLAEEDEHITFEGNDDFVPTEYKVNMAYESFVQRPAGEQVRPPTSRDHDLEIVLDAEYPLSPPQVRWVTKIFHPNIREQDGAVCLGQLQDRYIPNMGMARLMAMLIEIAQWRNFDIFNPFNKEAAQWANNPAHWPYIRDIGGSPPQISRKLLLNPDNWGVQADRRSPFYGYKQPDDYRLQWEREQQRDRIPFKKIR